MVIFTQGPYTCSFFVRGRFACTATVNANHARKRRKNGSRIGYVSILAGPLPSRQAPFFCGALPSRQAQWMCVYVRFLLCHWCVRGGAVVGANDPFTGPLVHGESVQFFVLSILNNLSLSRASYSAGLLTWPTGTGHFRRGGCLGSHRRPGPKMGAIDAST